MSESDDADDEAESERRLFDFIDRKMGSERQRPMMFGEMAGRVVLKHNGLAHRAGDFSLPVDGNAGRDRLSHRHVQLLPSP